MLAGAAGGLGAIFRAPLGGALYVTEVLYSSTASESTALLPCLTSSIVAYSVFALFVSPEPVFRVPDYTFHGLTDLAPFALLGLAIAVGTAIAGRPPHRSVRAELPHTAPTLDGDD